MDISYDYYRIFYYVAKYGNITKAAAMLLANQPNLTRSIHVLESELGCALFIRSNRGMKLTPEGERLYRHVRVAFEQLEAGEAEVVESRNLIELRSPVAPAVLPEFGFHDNPEEAQWLIDNMEAIAEMTCQAICAFFEIPYVAPDNQVDIEPEPVPDVPESDTIYRVQVGAFKVKANADAYLAKVREIFPEAYIVTGEV